MKGLDRYTVEGIVCIRDGREEPVANLSVGGFFVTSPHLPQAGAVLPLELTLPDRPPIKLTGEVAWVNAPEEKSVEALPVGFGVRILRASFPDRMALLAVLRSVHPSAARR